MTNLLYALLLIFSAGAIGAALFGAYITLGIRVMGRNRRILLCARMLLTGIVITQGVLLYALIDAGTANPSGRAWLYALGLVIQSTGLIGAVPIVMDWLADAELKQKEIE